MENITTLFDIVEAYRKARELSDARVSTLVFNDGGKIKSLREGTDIGVRRLQRAIQWFSDNWPENAVWPLSVARPDPAPAPVPSADF